MATLAPSSPAAVSGDRFFMWTAIVMALVIVAGFSLHLATGRSSFSAPLLVHLHALAYMGWTALFVTQARLATAGPLALHRKLGWIGAGWLILLIVMGLAITVYVTMEGSAPFFFLPQYFLIANPLTLACFALLTASAIRLRRQTDWHSRLHICGMAAIMGPAIGRILPSPFMGPHAFDISVLAGLIFPLAGMIRDLRRDGKVHAAWVWGTLSIVAIIPVAHGIAYSFLGDAIYAWVTAGHLGADVPGLEFGPPPPSS
jgi:hypothetical protein